MPTDDPTRRPSEPEAPAAPLADRPLPGASTDLNQLGGQAQGELGPADEPRVEPDTVSETVGTGSFFAIGCVAATVAVILVAVVIFLLSR